MNRTHRGEWDLGTQIDLLEAQAATCGYFRRCQGLWKKGDQVLNWNSVLQYKGTQVMISPSFILSISPLPQYGFWPTLVPAESYVEGESNGAGCKVFGGELTEDIGFYWRTNQSVLIRIINAFYFRLCFHWPPLPYAKGFSSILDHFQWGLESFWDRNTGFVSEFPGFGMFLSRKSVVRWDSIVGDVYCLIGVYL